MDRLVFNYRSIVLNSRHTSFPLETSGFPLLARTPSLIERFVFATFSSFNMSVMLKLYLAGEI